MSGLKRGNYPALLTLLGVMLVIGAVVLNAPSYWQYIATIGAAQAIIGLSVGLIYGTAGMLSLAQLSLAAIGAWTVGWLTADLGIVPLPWSIAIGALVAVPIGLLVALPALRLRGVNLAVVTLGFVVVIYTLATGEQVPGSQSTLYVLRPEWLNTDSSFFVFGWLSFLILAALIIVLRKTRLGLGWLAIAKSERAAASLGVSIIRSKMSAFAISAFIAGWAGGILVVVYGSSDSGSFSPIQALLFFVLAVMFGAGYWEGALALGTLNTLLSAVLRQYGISPDLGSILFGLGAVQVLSMGSKRGFSGDIRALLSKLRLRFSRAQSTAIELLTAPRLAIELTGAESAVNALEVRDLTVRYGAVVALDSVNLTVPAGRVVGLVGPNGAGKSTLIDAITGYVPPATGSVSVSGSDLAGMPVFRRAALVRRTFQQERTLDELTARDYLKLAAGTGVSKARIDEIIEFTGIPNPDTELRHLDVRARRLLTTGGAVIASPDVVLLDEPAAGLSAEESTDMASRIREIPIRFGCGVLLIEHDMDMVRLACTEVTVLDFGKILTSGSTADVLADPVVTKAYLGDEMVEL